MFKTYSKKASEIEHKWVLIDAANVPVGRLATFVATRLTGKYQPSFTPHMDSGDNVVIINADAAVLTGAKGDDKKYYTYSGFPSGIKQRTSGDIGMARVIENAVRGMLPKNKLQAERMKRLRVFAGGEHDHTAQSPETLTIKETK
ncbi:MAG: 50S ribosomal protein L13 [Candidatus Nomurabacteria bacterium]|jgi:large subunit ribosomal protein L13|nr:50S ribosomal protein L13 [Candidatus Nomurabacteria bacterium]